MSSQNGKLYQQAYSLPYDHYMNQPLFNLGPVPVTRRYLAQIGVPHFGAAATLGRVLEHKGVRTVRELMRLAATDLAAVPGIGERALVVGATLIAAAGEDVDRWLGWSNPAEVRKFSTVAGKKKKGRKKR